MTDNYTASDALLDAMQAMNVEVLFGNFGSDHPEFIESMAKAQQQGKAMPKVIVSPHESAALSAAHGYAQLRGNAQAVFVHCDVGTQTLGGSLHNISRSRVPCFIFAGETPMTIANELFGGRNRPVQNLQDTHDQHSIVRSYVKWSAPLKTGQNAGQMAWRALQIANTQPCGPTYLTGAREYLSETVQPSEDSPAQWAIPEAGALSDSMVAELVKTLDQAESPLIITSYCGRKAAAVSELVKLAETLSVPVVENFRSYGNFPTDHPLHTGFNADQQVAEADVILVLDSDVPWNNSAVQPRDDAQIFHLDQDCLKTGLVLWHSPATRAAQVDVATALQQCNSWLAQYDAGNNALRQQRLDAATAKHQQQRANWQAIEQTAQQKAEASGEIEAPFLIKTLAELIDDDTIVMDETITNFQHVWKHLPRNQALRYFESGGSSLGWHGGAAIGAKLAEPDKTVVALTGDGSYLFSVPSAVHWMAKQYQTPFLTVIFNNGGWNATKQNVRSLHPDGVAATTDQYWVNLGQDTDLAGIAAAAGGALALTVNEASALREALVAGLAAVKSGRAAVIDVRLAPISEQDYS